jgi:hypothetical protein
MSTKKTSQAFLKTPTLSKKRIKEQRIRAFQSQYKIKFDMTDKAIDLRNMSKNYADSIIPSADITAAVDAVLGPAPVKRASIDPRKLNMPIPKFAWVHIDDVAVHTLFQRDISPKHCQSIEPIFQSDTIIVPCAVKDPITGKYLLWDGNHTRQVCERQGWSHIPVWYTEADVSNQHSLQQAREILVQQAGQKFLIINKTGKRDVDLYDEHMISVGCGMPDAVAIQNLLKANNCHPRRAGIRPGDVTHFSNLYAAYDIPRGDIKGVYLSRSLKFHRSTWPKEKVQGVMLLAMARLYALTEMQTGAILPNSFDQDLGALLTKHIGTSEKVHLRLQQAFEKHIGARSNAGVNIPMVVTSGLITLYNQNIAKQKLAQPDPVFPL